MPGVSGSPVNSAVWRVCRSAGELPLRIHSVELSGSPLSKTEDVADEARSATKSLH